MPEDIFKYVYLSCFVAGLVVRTVCMARVPQWWRKQDQTAVDQGSLAEKLIMVLIFAGMQLLPVLYLAHLLWAAAQAPLLQNWIAGPAFLIASLPLYVLRIPREERMMQERFGDAYSAYQERTGRIFPRLRG
jgi:protein-S-isoprenylcysteine O-methyltransferase Ste14